MQVYFDTLYAYMYVLFEKKKKKKQAHRLHARNFRHLHRKSRNQIEIFTIMVYSIYDCLIFIYFS